MTQRKKKTITIQEFKAWLEGVEEMQGSTWAPDAQQWKRIRQKINQIEALPTEATTLPAGAPSTFNSQRNIPISSSAPVNDENIVIPAIPSSFERAGVKGGAPAPKTIIPTSAPGLKRTVNPQGQEKVKTPDIDTSGGDYTSSFE